MRLHLPALPGQPVGGPKGRSVCAYAIAKNEAKHVERWEKASRQADHRVIVDTGSTDATVAICRELGIEVHEHPLDPFAFDTARNLALGYVPLGAWAVNVDLDEVLHAGWREALDDLPADVTRPRYRVIFTEGYEYAGHAIGLNDGGYEWRGSIHEYLTRKESASPEVQAECSLTMSHQPDRTKSRSQYLPMLERAVEDQPDNARHCFYLGREYTYYGRGAEAVPHLKRQLELETWQPERAASMRLLAGCLPAEGEQWLLRACAETPGRREPWVDLAQHYYSRQDWSGCFMAAKRALAITERDLGYFTEPAAWGYLPHDLAALAAYNLGLYEEALRHGRAAFELAPDEQRLETNLEWYEQATGEMNDLLTPVN